MSSSVAIIDYGMGNLHSIAKAIQHADPKSEITIATDAAAILNADRVVFPGVGAIKDCMSSLAEFGFTEVIYEVAQTKPLLCICLGMQALMTDSEENNHIQCLNVIPGHVVHFSDLSTDSHGAILKIPHMGWNQVHQIAHPLWNGIAQDSRFYFVHSYYVVPNAPSVITATTEYSNKFTSALAWKNIFAVQFHPEKSQAVGIQLLKNFLDWDGQL